MALPTIAVPKYTLTIPSTQVEVEFRPYLVGEEKILLIASESNDENVMMKAIGNIISRCITENINPNKLKTFDIEYIFTQLKAKSSGESSELIINCKKCETHNTLIVDVENQVEVADLNRDSFKIEINDSVGIMMKYLSMEDSFTYNDNDNDDLSDTDKVFNKLIKCIDYVYEGDTIHDLSEESDDSMMTFIESLNSLQFKLLTDFIEKMPQVVLKTEFKCKECDELNEVKLTGIENFF
jgi:hypothetical protein